MKKLKKALKDSKETAIKESIYTNSVLPNTWKNRQAFKKEAMKIVASDKKLFEYLYDERKSEKELVTIQSEIEIANRTQYESTLFQTKKRRDDVLDNLKKITFKEPCEEEVAKKLVEKRKTYMNTINSNRTDFPVISKLPKGKLLLILAYKTHTEIFNQTQKTQMLKTSIFNNILPPKSFYETQPMSIHI
jgi:hypothetical protein